MLKINKSAEIVVTIVTYPKGIVWDGLFSDVAVNIIYCVNNAKRTSPVNAKINVPLICSKAMAGV